MVPPADNPAHLSVTRAFVVQFRADTTVEQEHLAGRVEHVVSGQATGFESLNQTTQHWHTGSSRKRAVATPSGGQV